MLTHGDVYPKHPIACCLAMLQPGDCVILNAANSTVGQVIIQLCSLLQLRCVAVVRQRCDSQEGSAHTADRLKALGASLVVQDTGSLKVGFLCFRPPTATLVACSNWLSMQLCCLGVLC